MTIRRALFSVYDKTGLATFARELSGLGVELVARQLHGDSRVVGGVLGIRRITERDLHAWAISAALPGLV